MGTRGDPFSSPSPPSSSAAPRLGEERPPLKQPRRRKRGPRSLLILRHRFFRGFPPRVAGGKSPAMTLARQPTSSTRGHDSSTRLPDTHLPTFLQINARSLNSKIRQAELSNRLTSLQPDIILLTETWLDSSTPYLNIDNFHHSYLPHFLITHR